DESTLTGESEPVDKQVTAVEATTPLADRRSMVYAGTTASSGSARAIVVATGARTEVGAIQRALSHVQPRAAPLERQLDALGRTLAGLTLGGAGAVFGL